MKAKVGIKLAPLIPKEQIQDEAMQGIHTPHSSSFGANCLS